MKIQSEEKINFASDNYSPVHPKVLRFLTEANGGPEPAYGADSVTFKALQKIKMVFGENAEAFLVWNGTSANVLGLSAALKSHQCVLCSDFAHISVDECGAPEKFTGSKVISVPSQGGKLGVEKLESYFQRTGDPHASQVKVISISQSTEYGTLYSRNEIKALADFAHSKNAYLHVDGARLSNAAVGLGCSLKELTADLGVDILSFGGTKNGLMGAECVVFFRKELAENFEFVRKQGLQLASKMRFLAAQFLAYLDGDLWKQNADNANRMAKLLESGLNQLGPEVRITQPVQANVVFATLPESVILTLQKKFHFYVWNASIQEVRLMCSFNTTSEEVRAFLKEARNLLAP